MGAENVGAWKREASMYDGSSCWEEGGGVVAIVVVMS